MRVAKWGNSLAVHLPAGLVDEWGLREGDEVEIVVYLWPGSCLGNWTGLNLVVP